MPSYLPVPAPAPPVPVGKCFFFFLSARVHDCNLHAPTRASTPSLHPPACACLGMPTLSRPRLPARTCCSCACLGLGLPVPASPLRSCQCNSRCHAPHQLLYSEESTIVGLLKCRSCEQHKGGQWETAGLLLPVYHGFGLRVQVDARTGTGT